MLYENITDGIFSGELPVVEDQYFVIFQLLEHFIAIITTTEESSITNTSAMSGGDVSFDGNLAVTARGVCWNTSTNPTIANNKTINGSGQGSFSSKISGLTINTSYFARAYATNAKGTSYGDNVTFATLNLHIGDAYQGGIVAYISPDGENGFIAAASDQSAAIQWRNGSDIATGATATAIGTGNANTNTIVSAQGSGSYAAKLCSDLSLNGYTDWYLPSRDELLQMFNNRVAIGGFVVSTYWSSSEAAWDLAINVAVMAPDQVYYINNPKYNQMAVRAIRSF